jgi:hypothetical protein
VWEPDGEDVVPFSSHAEAVALSPHARWAVAATGTTIERVELQPPHARERREMTGSFAAGELAISDRGDIGTCTSAGVVLWPRGGAPANVGRHRVVPPEQTTHDGCSIVMTDDAAITADRLEIVEWHDGKPTHRYEIALWGKGSPTLNANGSTIVADDAIIDRATHTVRTRGASEYVHLVASPNLGWVATERGYDPVMVVTKLADSTSRQIAIDNEVLSGAFAPDARSMAIYDRSANVSRIDLAGSGAATVLGSIAGDRPWIDLGFVGASTFATLDHNVVRFWDIDRARSDRSVAIETLEDATLDRSSWVDVHTKYAWRAIDRAVVIVTVHGARTIRDDLPAGPALRDRLGRYAIDPASSAVTIAVAAGGGSGSIVP